MSGSVNAVYRESGTDLQARFDETSTHASYIHTLESNFDTFLPLGVAVGVAAVTAGVVVVPVAEPAATGVDGCRAIRTKCCMVGVQQGPDLIICACLHLWLVE